MSVLENSAIVALLILNIIINVCGQIRPETIKRNNEICKKLAQDPYFEIEMVVGKPWRTYYTWNMKIGAKCFDMVFRNATPQITQRIWNDMYDYLEQQPDWDAATLYITMGKTHHELLLFADQGAAGSFTAVPNVIRDGNIPPNMHAVPLLRFHLKLLQQGRFLIISDCNIGVSSLSARFDRPVYQSEILAATAPLGLGDGFQACTTDKNEDEHILNK